ncbi:Hypothetical protein LOCK900_2123 [Lacticaseibacillus rhamnosus LOCK900]|nr:Hypothetical protein LOCK900_2123 [Lacticaseibacillus rhamnosus LOCK900]EHJ27055.1 hypothetical protein HMPREF0541_02669 [Lacticaseibacillus rhamnosus ATCC 21052]
MFFEFDLITLKLYFIYTAAGLNDLDPMKVERNKFTNSQKI